MTTSDKCALPMAGGYECGLPLGHEGPCMAEITLAAETPSESPGSMLHTMPGFAGRESHRSGPIAQMATDAAGSTPLTDKEPRYKATTPQGIEIEAVDIEHARALELRCRSLAMIFPKILEALGNGSACVGEGNSIEFLQDIPNEVRLVVQGYQRRCRNLEAALKEAQRGLKFGGDLAGLTETTDSQANLAGRALEAIDRAEKALKSVLSQGSGGGSDA